MAELPATGLVLLSNVTAGQVVELFLQSRPVPEPGPDEVIVRVEAAPINPSDLGVLLAGADVTKAAVSGPPEQPVLRAPVPDAAFRAAAARVGTPLPTGNEGAGTVVAAGNSPAAQALLGKAVAAAGGGMYAEYRRAPAAACLVLPDGASPLDGASSYVNPMTALGMIETMRLEHHTALVHTAAASNLGQMLLRLCAQEQVPLVNIVRRPEQEDLLRKAGASYVCNSSAPGFADDLTAALTETGATLAFDATGGGTLASQVLTCMERALNATAQGFSRYGSAVHKQVYIYGSLNRSPVVLDRTYGMAWGVGGWLLTNFLLQLGPDGAARLRRRVADGLTTTFASTYSAQISLRGALTLEALADYARQATGSKYVIIPSRAD